jgi:hypothetical protein
MVRDSDGDSLGGEEPILREIGWEGTAKTREAYMLEIHLTNINRLFTQNISDMETRASVKSALLGLESFMRPYIDLDDKYTEEVKAIKTGRSEGVQSEIQKITKWYGVLRSMISRTTLFEKPRKQYATRE